MEVSWHADGDPTATALAIRSAGGQVENEMGFEPLTTLAVAAASIVVVRAIKAVVQDVRHCGVIVDTTTTPVGVREMRGWDRGVVMVLTANGYQLHSLESADADVAGLVAALAAKG